MFVGRPGGSIGGLCAGVALHGIGCEVDVHKRTPGAMTSRGAGIVVQDDLLRLLRQHGAPELVRFFDQSFTFCEARSGGHVLCYFIPGPNAATELGRRRLNWVWYVNVPAGPRLDRLLTDRNGELARRGTSAMPPPAEGRAGCTARLAGS